MSQLPLDPTIPSDTEISLGRELRRAREVRGISLEQIAAETKIAERYLHALEADRLDLLPGPLYARNFVRQYALFIGADEEELLDYFKYQQRLHDEAAAATGKQDAGGARRRAVAIAGLGLAALVIVTVLAVSLLARGDESPPVDPGVPAAGTGSAVQPPLAAPTGPDSAAPASSSLPVLAQGASARTETQAVPAAPSTTQAPRLAAPTAAATAPAETAVAPAPPAGCEHVPVARLVFDEESWVEIRKQGDEQPTFGLQRRGTSLSYQLDQPLTILVGNAGGVSLYLDDQRAKALGARSESRKLPLDCRNYRSYL